MNLASVGYDEVQSGQIAKIAALGLRIRKGCCYHGLSLNINMDLKPFSNINPCGFEGLAVTQMVELNSSVSVEKWVGS